MTKQVPTADLPLTSAALASWTRDHDPAGKLGLALGPVVRRADTLAGRLDALPPGGAAPITFAFHGAGDAALAAALAGVLGSEGFRTLVGA